MMKEEMIPVGKYVVLAFPGINTTAIAGGLTLNP
jgi:hypothetical protein